MAQVPYPITEESATGILRQVNFLFRDLYEERLAGLGLGDVFADGGDILELQTIASGGLEKVDGELGVELKPAGGLQNSSTGVAIKCKSSGGMATDASGLYIESAVTKGFREGLEVTIKDADELYVSGGAMEINGVSCGLTTQQTVSVASCNANTLYYIYASVVSTTWTFTVSTTVPLFSDSLGGYYMTGDTTKRLLAKYYQAGGTAVSSPGVEADDGWWRSNTDFYNSAAYQIYAGIWHNTEACTSFIRFPTCPVAQGETISGTILTLEAMTGSAFTTNIYANDIDNAIAPTSYATGDALVKTTATVSWTVPSWVAGSKYTSPDISAPIQEVIDRPSYSQNNAIMLLLYRAPTGSQQYGIAKCFGDGAGNMPTLTMVINPVGVSKVIDYQRLDVARDSDNVLNDEEILAYDTVLKGCKGVSVPEERLVGRITGGETAALTASQSRTLLGLDTDDDVTLGTVTASATTNGTSPNYSRIAACGRFIPYGSATTTVADINMNTHQLTALSVPDANGEAIRATAKITEALLESATDLKHAAVTVSAPIVLTGQAIELKNNAGSPAQVTAIDTGELANSDTVIPTSKAVLDRVHPFRKIETGKTVLVKANQQYLVMNSLKLEGSVTLEAGAELIIGRC